MDEQRRVETIEEFKLRISAMIHGKPERITGSLQTRMGQSVQSPLAAGAWVAAEIQPQCAGMFHRSADISAASFSAPSSHLTLMMRAMYSCCATSTEVIYGARCFSIASLPGKLSRWRPLAILLRSEAHSGRLARAHLITAEKWFSSLLLSARSTATFHVGQWCHNKGSGRW
jgi:hypothetical protein